MKLLVIITGIHFVSCIALLTGIFLFYQGDVAPGIRMSNILRVRLGMTHGEVENLLGNPYDVVSYKGSLTHKLNCDNYSETIQTLSVISNKNIDKFFQHINIDTIVHSCDLNDARKHDRKTTFTYTYPGGLLSNYPMLWIHFDRTGKVNNIYSKEYAVNDSCIYSLETDSSQNISNKKSLCRLFGK